MKTIRCNEDIILQEGLNEFIIDSIRDLNLSFTCDVDCEVFVRIVACRSLKISSFTEQGRHVSFLFWNECSSHLQVEESHIVMKDGDLSVAYGEVNPASMKRHVQVALRQPGANALVSSASLVKDRKDYVIEVINYAPHTNGNMKNFAVMMEGGNLSIDAVGKIVKGAHGSQSHQTSRALSFEPGQHATIVPELLIDEDDVQASHAMSMGSVDPDHLYYMQTRGLSLSQCISLISTGYLLPIVDTIADETLKGKLREQLEKEMAEL